MSSQREPALKSTLWRALTRQAPQPGCPAGDPASTLWPVATCRGPGSLSLLKAYGVRPPKAKAVTDHRTPKLDLPRFFTTRKLKIFRNSTTKRRSAGAR